MTPFTKRLHEALDFAAINHDGQSRKDADVKIPCLSHSFAVAHILAQYDFAEEVVIAGVLHDIIEDVVERKHRPNVEEEIQRRFGDRVHQLVRFVTQTRRAGGWRELDWHTRGELYRLVMCDPATPDDARAISCADKIHNIESLLMACERMKGREKSMWRKMKATPAEQAEKFRLLHDGISAVWHHPIVDVFGERIKELEGILPDGRELRI